MNSRNINFLLIFVPIGITVGALNMAPLTVFILNFMAVVALAPFITMTVFRLSVVAGAVWGGLMRAVLGNAMEMMVRRVLSLG